MKCILRLLIIPSLFIPFIACNKPSQGNYFIDRVEVRAEKSDIKLDDTEKEFIKKVARIPSKKVLKAPFAINPFINYALKKLATNGYIARIEKEVVKGRKGKVRKVVIVICKKLFFIESIQWSGVAYSDKKQLEKKIPLKVSYYYDPNQLKYTNKLIKKYFLEKGYLDVFVQAKPIERDNSEHKVVIRVYRGKKYYIEEVVLQGNKGVNTLLLSKQIPVYGKETKGYKALKKNIVYHIRRQEFLSVFYSLYAQLRYQLTFTKNIIEEVVALLTSYYQNEKGFLSAEITPTITVNRKTKKVYITFLIKENQQSVVNKINWVGNEVMTDKELNKALGFSVGMPYNIKKIRSLLESKQKLKGLYSLYEKKGIFLSYVRVTGKHLEKGKVNLIICIKEMKKPHIVAIDIKGNLNKKIGKGILAANNLEIGKVYNGQNLLFARKELAASELVDPHKMKIRATEGVDANGKRGVVIDAYLPISVVSHGNLTLDMEKVEGHLLITNINLLPLFKQMRLPTGGGGMSIEFKFGREHDYVKRYMPFNLEVEVKHPWIFIGSHRCFLAGKYRYRIHPSKEDSLYNSRLWELQMGHSQNFGEHRGSFTVAISHTQGKKFLPIEKRKVNFTKYETRLNYVLTNVDHFFYPTQGYKALLNLDIAFPPGKICYIRPHLATKWYYPLGSYILMQQLEGGINVSQDGIAGNFTLRKEDDALHYPISLRGHNKNPAPLFANQYGTDMYLTYHTEVRKQIFNKNTYVAFFANLGMMRQSAYSSDTVKRWGVGVGFTQRFKIGPFSIYLIWTDSIIPRIEFGFHTSNHQE